MLVILEGCDRSGKSTLARAISKRIEELYPGDRVELFPAGPPTTHALDAYERPLFTYNPEQQLHVVCDRWHVGESVYPALFGRKTTMNPAVRLHVNAFLRARGALLVHVRADRQTLRDRLLTEEHEHPGKSLVSWQQLCASDDTFAVEVARTPLKTITVNNTSGASVTNIVNATMQLNRAVIELGNLRTYVGGPHPRLLLVGDVRHSHRDMHTSVAALHAAQLDPAPAFMPYPGTSGEFLCTVLHNARLRSRVGIVNANDVDDAHFAWKVLGEPPAVALGKNAWNTVKSWAAGAVPHPQYVRRFLNCHKSWYGKLITTAARGHNLLQDRPAGTWLDRKCEDHD